MYSYANGSTSESPIDDRLPTAIASANIPTLLMVLVHLTGDLVWLEERYRPKRAQGISDNDEGGLPPEVREEIRSAAIDAIRAWQAGRPMAVGIPDQELLARMMNVAVGEVVPPEYGPMVTSELRVLFDHEVGKDQVMVQQGFKSALIVGAGVSGVCAAIALEASGVEVQILEANSRPGGTWENNKYPGVGVDTPSHLYSFSFAPHDWPRYFSAGGDVRRYIEGVIEDYELTSKVCYDTEVMCAEYDEVRQSWTVTTRSSEGEVGTRSAQLLVSAVGALNRPKIPDLDGADEFRGPKFHTAQWPQEFDVHGKRIALIGNGASAMQLLPAIVDAAEHVTIFQRSPQWAAPFEKCGVTIPDEVRWLLHAVPVYRIWYRIRLGWAFNDAVFGSLRKDPHWPYPAISINAANDRNRKFLTKYIESELGDRQDLASKCVPTYPPFGKRMLLDNGWFRSVKREDVTLETTSVRRITAGGVVTSDGTEYNVDAIVYATGFDAVHFLSTIDIRGREGRSIHDVWGDGDGRAYLGTMVPGFPNFFCMYGPNLQPGHGGSLMFMIECQVHWMIEVLKLVSGHDGSVECTNQAYEDYNAEVDQLHEDLIWTHPGMRTYARNDNGRVVLNSPYRVVDYWTRTRTVDRSAIQIAQKLLKTGNSV